MQSEQEDQTPEHVPSSSAQEEACPPSEDFVVEQGQPVERTAELIHKLEAEKKQLLEQLMRKQAELENFRKRTQREKEEFLQYSLSSTLQSLLPVLDGFELALASDGGGEDYRRGVELIYQQLCGTLEKLGLERMETKGREFDPYLHEAVAIVESMEFPDQQVVEEIQGGYLFKQRVLRPAMVKVSRQPSATPAAEGDTAQTDD